MKRQEEIEIAKKIEDSGWIEVRNLELGKPIERVEQSVPEGSPPVETASVEEDIVVEDVVSEETISDKIIDYIKKQDSGDGVDFDDIANAVGDGDAIKNLLTEGELFEIRPGRLKVLE